MSCICAVPVEPADPRHAGECCKCGRPIAGPGISTDETTNAFLGRLEEGMHRYWPSHARAAEPEGEEKEREFFRSVAALVAYREREGREKFGFDYLKHDFNANVSEEAADIVCYAMLKNLRTLRETGDERGIEILLQGCGQVIAGLKTLLGYEAKRLGSP